MSKPSTGLWYCEECQYNWEGTPSQFGRRCPDCNEHMEFTNDEDKKAEERK